jgi:hypothetical protein
MTSKIPGVEGCSECARNQCGGICVNRKSGFTQGSGEGLDCMIEVSRKDGSQRRRRVDMVRSGSVNVIIGPDTGEERADEARRGKQSHHLGRVSVGGNPADLYTHREPTTGLAICIKSTDLARGGGKASLGGGDIT